jgi:hypothetical protein
VSFKPAFSHLRAIRHEAINFNPASVLGNRKVANRRIKTIVVGIGFGIELSAEPNRKFVWVHTPHKNSWGRGA